MGERQNELNPVSPAEHERRIAGLRGELSSTVDELERRAREATDVKLQIRRHPTAFALGGAAILAIGVSIIGSIVRSRSSAARTRRLLGAIATLRAHPERLAAPTPSPSRRALAAVLAAAGTTIARQLVSRAMANAESRRPVSRASTSVVVS